jgi:hypothetical protein
MKIEIVNRGIKDRTVDSILIKMLEYFTETNAERANSIKEKSEYKPLLIELINYLEVGLKSKFSLNFNVLISEHPCYALKYEKQSIMILKYNSFEILIFKTPPIAIPTLLFKALSEDENTAVDKYIQERGQLVKSENLKVIRYNNKSLLDSKFKKLEQFTEGNILNIVIRAIGYYLKCCNEKEIARFPLFIQNDLSSKDGDYE